MTVDVAGRQYKDIGSIEFDQENNATLYPKTGGIIEIAKGQVITVWEND